jgi:hypothetical protein
MQDSNGTSATGVRYVKFFAVSDKVCYVMLDNGEVWGQWSIGKWERWPGVPRCPFAMGPPND